jgi:protease-4
MTRSTRTGITRRLALAGLILITAAAPAPAQTTADAPSGSQPKPTIAHIRMAGRVLHREPEFDLFGDSSTYMTLRDWLRRLAKARNDPQVGAVVLDVADLQVDWAQAVELADAVRRLDRVKPVFAHLVQASAGRFLVASSARYLAMEPAGEVNVTGIAAEAMFFRGTLDWLGVQPQFVQIGEFKGASEPIMRTEPSPELRAEYDKLLDGLYDQMVEQIAVSRDLEPSAVRRAIDVGPLPAELAREHRLVDELVARVDMMDRLEARARDEVDDLGGIALHYAKKAGPAEADLSNPFKVFSLLLRKPQGRVEDPTIAIIHADGMISGGKSGETALGQRVAGARTLTRVFREVREDDRIKAVIFRIDSPGGSALASELIFQAARRCGQVKPVIASISNVGASGGYYIALAADTILADAGALVGNVGVVGGKFSLAGLYDKLGMQTYSLTRGKNAGLWLTGRPWTPREQAVIRELMQSVYADFVGHVRDRRGDRIGDVDAVTRGRTFTAAGAVQAGLVDQVGGLKDAVAMALKAAQIDSAHYQTLPRPKTLMDMLTEDGGVHSPSLAPATLEARMLRQHAKNRPGLAYLVTLADLLQRESVALAGAHYFQVTR